MRTKKYFCILIAVFAVNLLIYSACYAKSQDGDKNKGNICYTLCIDNTKYLGDGAAIKADLYGALYHDKKMHLKIRPEKLPCDRESLEAIAMVDPANAIKTVPKGECKTN